MGAVYWPRHCGHSRDSRYRSLSKCALLTLVCLYRIETTKSFWIRVYSCTKYNSFFKSFMIALKQIFYICATQKPAFLQYKVIRLYDLYNFSIDQSTFTLVFVDLLENLFKFRYMYLNSTIANRLWVVMWIRYAYLSGVFKLLPQSWITCSLCLRWRGSDNVLWWWSKRQVLTTTKTHSTSFSFCLSLSLCVYMFLFSIHIYALINSFTGRIASPFRSQMMTLILLTAVWSLWDPRLLQLVTAAKQV